VPAAGFLVPARSAPVLAVAGTADDTATASTAPNTSRAFTVIDRCRCLVHVLPHLLLAESACPGGQHPLPESRIVRMPPFPASRSAVARLVPVEAPMTSAQEGFTQWIVAPSKQPRLPTADGSVYAVLGRQLVPRYARRRKRSRVWPRPAHAFLAVPLELFSRPRSRNPRSHPRHRCRRGVSAAWCAAAGCASELGAGTPRGRPEPRR
jgi:hypothetical protein